MIIVFKSTPIQKKTLQTLGFKLLAIILVAQKKLQHDCGFYFCKRRASPLHPVFLLTNYANINLPSLLSVNIDSWSNVVLYSLVETSYAWFGRSVFVALQHRCEFLQHLSHCWSRLWQRMTASFTQGSQKDNL